VDSKLAGGNLKLADGFLNEIPWPRQLFPDTRSSSW